MATFSSLSNRNVPRGTKNSNRDASKSAQLVETKPTPKQAIVKPSVKSVKPKKKKTSKKKIFKDFEE